MSSHSKVCAVGLDSEGAFSISATVAYIFFWQSDVNDVSSIARNLTPRLVRAKPSIWIDAASCDGLLTRNPVVMLFNLWAIEAIGGELIAVSVMTETPLQSWSRHESIS